MTNDLLIVKTDARITACMSHQRGQGSCENCPGHQSDARTQICDVIQDDVDLTTMIMPPAPTTIEQP